MEVYKLKKYLSSFLAVLIIFILIAGNSCVFAANKATINNAIGDTDEQIKQKQDEIGDVQEQMSEARKEINKLNTQISNYEDEIDELDSQLSELKSSIKEQEEKLKTEEQNYKKQEELFHQRLIALYESGETTYVDVLLGSQNITEFLSYYYMMSEIAESDKEMLNSIENKKQEIQTTKDSLQASKDQVAAKKESKEKTKQALASAKSTKNKQMSELSDTEKQLQEELEEFEKHKKELQAELKRIAEEEAKKNNTTKVNNNPSSAGYIFPVAGLSKANITNKSYPSYAGHTGVDINKGTVGKSVVAVKAGTVVISEAKHGSIKNYDSNGNYIGSYSSYGEYIIINHHDGTMTLYGHLKAGSRKVSVGENVKQGQVIGTVGNTGNCLPRPTASNPTQGTHLHFEVRISGSPVNPIPYLP